MVKNPIQVVVVEVIEYKGCYLVVERKGDSLSAAYLERFDTRKEAIDRVKEIRESYLSK